MPKVKVKAKPHLYLWSSPGEESVRAGWQKRLNITVDNCDSVQVKTQSINSINQFDQSYMLHLIFNNLYVMSPSTTTLVTTTIVRGSHHGRSINTDDLTKVLEHVHVVVDISSRNKRGEFEIRLTSPSGTESKLLALRPLDNSISGFANFRTWPLMSTHYWGEQTKGR